MLRPLSLSLILILLLISPLSFSTDKIPNFTCETPISTGCAIKTNRSGVLDQPNPRVRPQKLSTTSQRYSFPEPLIPAIESIFFYSHSRAPPTTPLSV